MIPKSVATDTWGFCSLCFLLFSRFRTVGWVRFLACQKFISFLLFLWMFIPISLLCFLSSVASGSVEKIDTVICPWCWTLKLSLSFKGPSFSLLSDYCPSLAISLQSAVKSLFLQGSVLKPPSLTMSSWVNSSTNTSFLLSCPQLYN